MNQWLADVFFSLPQALIAPHIFGILVLLFWWACYFADIRGPIERAVRATCGRSFWQAKLQKPWQRLFFGAARKKAKLDEGGVYLTNLAAFLLLTMTTVMHAALFIFCMQGMALASRIDSILLTVTTCIIGTLTLLTQPHTTIERRTRWGFRRTGSIVRAVLREFLIVAVIFLWIYAAWFYPALL